MLRGSLSTRALGFTIVAVALAACLGDDSSPRTSAWLTEPHAFTATYKSLDGRFEVSVNLDSRDAPVVAADGTKVRVAELSVTWLDDKQTPQAHRTYLLDGGMRLVRSEAQLPCRAMKDCVHDVSWETAGLMPPLGLAWPALVNNSTIPNNIFGSQLRVSTLSQGNALLPTADFEEQWPYIEGFPHRLTYGEGPLPLHIESSDGFRGNVELILVDYHPGLPLGHLNSWHPNLEFPAPPGAQHPRLFPGAHETTFNNQISALDALDFLRSREETVHNTLEEGGCIIHYHVFPSRHNSLTVGVVLDEGQVEHHDFYISHANGTSHHYRVSYWGKRIVGSEFEIAMMGSSRWSPSCPSQHSAAPGIVAQDFLDEVAIFLRDTDWHLRAFMFTRFQEFYRESHSTIGYPDYVVWIQSNNDDTPAGVVINPPEVRVFASNGWLNSARLPQSLLERLDTQGLILS